MPSDTAQPRMSTIARPWIDPARTPESYTAAELRLDKASRLLEAQVEGLEGATPEGLKAAYKELEDAIVDFAVERNDVVITLTVALREATAAVEQLSGKRKAQLVLANAGDVPNRGPRRN